MTQHDSDESPEPSALGQDRKDDPWVPPPPRDLRGRTIGRYHCEAHLLEGADFYAETHAARDPILDRRVILTICAAIRIPSLATELLRAEAKVQSQLSHAGIESVFDVGTSEEFGFYVVTEMLEGGSLAGMLEAGLPRPNVLAEVVRAVADALGYAHRRGFVHLNMKPRVVRLDANGRPKIGQFGLGGPLDELRRSPFRRIGTPYYMSPEQWRGAAEAITPATDVWSLGVLLYRGLTGKVPFGPTEDVREVARLARETSPVAPSSLVAAVPAGLEAVCLRCLEKDPARRYVDAQALAEALAALQTPAARAPRAFVSHSTLDRSFVEREIVSFLELHGVKTWYATADIPSAAVWERTILAGLEASDWFVLVMSPSAATSEWVKDELHWAVSHRPDRILPILIGDCDPWTFHMRLARLQHIDFRERPDEGREQMLERLRVP